MTQQFRKTAPATIAPRTAVATAQLQTRPQDAEVQAVNDNPAPTILVPDTVSYKDAVRLMCLNDRRSNPRYQSDYGPRPAGRLTVPHQEPEVFVKDDKLTAAENRANHSALQFRNRELTRLQVEAPYIAQSIEEIRKAAALALNGAALPIGPMQQLLNSVKTHWYDTVSIQGYIIRDRAIYQRFSIDVTLEPQVRVQKVPSGKKQRGKFLVSVFVPPVYPVDKQINKADEDLQAALLDTAPGDVVMIVRRPEKRRYASYDEQYAHIQECTHLLKITPTSTIDA